MLKKTVNKIIPKSFYPTFRKIYYIAARLIHKGNIVYCPVCERTYKRFLPGVDNKRSNVKCPGCGTLERHRLLWLYLAKKLAISELQLDLLDIAPDQAIQSKLKKLSNIKYTAVDLYSPLADKKMDLTNLSFDNESFDAVICYHVLEHIVDDIKAMKEIFRVLKTGGWAILQSPVDLNREITYEDFSIKTQEGRLKAFGQNDHVRIYGKDYTKILTRCGFVVEEDNFVLSFSEDEITRFGLDKNELIYFCRK